MTSSSFFIPFLSQLLNFVNGQKTHSSILSVFTSSWTSEGSMKRAKQLGSRRRRHISMRVFQAPHKTASADHRVMTAADNRFDLVYMCFVYHLLIFQILYGHVQVSHAVECRVDGCRNNFSIKKMYFTSLIFYIPLNKKKFCLRQYRDLWYQESVGKVGNPVHQHVKGWPHARFYSPMMLPQRVVNRRLSDFLPQPLIRLLSRQSPLL
jgi:hypothetical protein